MKRIKFLKLSKILNEYNFNYRDLLAYWFTDRIYIFYHYDNQDCFLYLNSKEKLEKSPTTCDIEKLVSCYNSKKNKLQSFTFDKRYKLELVSESLNMDLNINYRYKIKGLISGYWPLQIKGSVNYTNDVYHIIGDSFDGINISMHDEQFKELMISGIPDIDRIINDNDRDIFKYHSFDLITLPKKEKVAIGEFYILEKTFLTLAKKNKWRPYPDINKGKSRTSAQQSEAIYILYKKLSDDFYELKSSKNRSYSSTEFNKDLNLLSEKKGNKIKFNEATTAGWVNSYPEIKLIKKTK
ncbi:hypothetical protein AB7092_21600 [Providencia rettgeri]|jgi:hypothetical protein|uniref:Uncharacterized protein n=1 Tax=Providencia rettgeri TaxID=587 RepID=A0A379FVW2_PRORE|nr:MULTISPECIES: hypothetical protein [Morganellaceae]EKH6496984.1 hypothetical protein [Providencia rettgeri]ELR5050839.1 hypothetical protein [Providencia rettgeri]ELR5154794.1 hypothetical protein [Providencia rettgeri]ELR5181636.1 hypothetical protein [Providencia rettgeri]ELR5265737.1 hypothetical protein [Providencia rettgeri]